MRNRTLTTLVFLALVFQTLPAWAEAARPDKVITTSPEASEPPAGRESGTGDRVYTAQPPESNIEQPPGPYMPYVYPEVHLDGQDFFPEPDKDGPVFYTPKPAPGESPKIVRPEKY
jgi:hypothetical protein